MCEVPAAQVQGGLGLSEVQAVPRLRPAESLPEGQLLGHRRRHLRGLPAWVCGQSSPWRSGRYSEEDFLSGSLPNTDAC